MTPTIASGSSPADSRAAAARAVTVPLPWLPVTPTPGRAAEQPGEQVGAVPTSPAAWAARSPGSPEGATDVATNVTPGDDVGAEWSRS